jgi:programmed cell death 6-interacting protein
LRFHNLPAALDALDKPIGLPPSLLKKAEEIRLENGPERVEKSLEDVQMLASRAMAILTEVRAHIIVINHFLIKFP